MLGKIQGMFAKVRHNVNAMNTTTTTTTSPPASNNNKRRDSHPSRRSSNAASPKQCAPYRASMSTDSAPNPLAHSPTSPRVAPAANAGSAQQQQQQPSRKQCQVNQLLFSALGSDETVQANAVDDAPQTDNAEHAVRRRQQEQSAQREQQQPQGMDRTPEEPLVPTQQQQQQQEPLSPAEAPARQQDSRTVSEVQYSTFTRIAAECGLVMEESSSGDYVRAASQTAHEATAPPRPQGPSLSVAPPEPPTMKLSASAAVSATSQDLRGHGGRQYSHMCDYNARMSTEYEALLDAYHDGWSGGTDEYEDMFGPLVSANNPASLITTTTIHSAKAAPPRPGTPVPPTAAAAVPTATTTTDEALNEPLENAQFSMVKAPSRRNRHTTTAPKQSAELKNDFLSGNYEPAYTYMNRLMQSATATSTKAANKKASGDSENGQHPFASRVPRLDTDDLTHKDSSASQLGPSTLRRANDLALSQWKYVALVVKKVAEKRSLVRDSRLRLDRQPSRVRRPGLSTVPLSRKASVNSVDSLVLSPEEERAEVNSEEEEDNEDACNSDGDSNLSVSVYDDSGAPLLIPNLSDLFNELQSDTDGEASAVLEEAVRVPANKAHNSDDGAKAMANEEEEEDATPLYRPSPPKTNHTMVNGGAFRRGSQQPYNNHTGSSPNAGQHYVHAQGNHYRQKMMQRQRQQLLMQQQRMQNCNYNPQQQHQQYQRPPYNTMASYAPHASNGCPPPQYGNGIITTSNSTSNSLLPKATVGMTRRPVPQPDIRFGPRLTGGSSRFVDFTALTGVRLADARVIASPVWEALEPPRR